MLLLVLTGRQRRGRVMKDMCRTALAVMLTVLLGILLPVALPVAESGEDFLETPWEQIAGRQMVPERHTSSRQERAPDMEESLPVLNSSFMADDFVRISHPTLEPGKRIPGVWVLLWAASAAVLVYLNRSFRLRVKRYVLRLSRFSSELLVLMKKDGKKRLCGTGGCSAVI